MCEADKTLYERFKTLCEADKTLHERFKTMYERFKTLCECFKTLCERFKTLCERFKTLCERVRALHNHNNLARNCCLKAYKYRFTAQNCRVQMCREIRARRFGCIANNVWNRAMLNRSKALHDRFCKMRNCTIAFILVNI
jgi:hypothetical protein